MDLEEAIKRSLNEDIKESRERFINSISQDENSDYRRGFLAGEFVARLHFRCALKEIAEKIKA